MAWTENDGLGVGGNLIVSTNILYDWTKHVGDC